VSEGIHLAMVVDRCPAIDDHALAKLCFGSGDGTRHHHTSRA
jgi:hypothetical protein